VSVSILSWNFWDSWLQKFTVQLISIKVLSLATSTVLCVCGFISGGNLATIWGIIFGLKEAFRIANTVIKNGNNKKDEEMIDKI
jgi:hypothetical protein